jgi:hypothetical protein
MTFSLSRIIDDGGGGDTDGGDEDAMADKDDAESRELASRYLHTFCSIQ